jgi:two-component system sensor histidine kinase UhpB
MPSKASRRSHDVTPPVSGRKLRSSGRGAPDASLGRLLETLEELRASQEQLQISAEELADVRDAVEVERHRYRELFQFAPDGYLVTSDQGVIEEANRAASELLGTPTRELIGKSAFVYVPRESRPTFLAEFRLAGRSDVPSLLETTLLPRDRPPIAAEIRLAAVHGPGDALIGFRWLIRDVSERQQGEARLRQYGDQLLALWSRLESVREEERASIARELHDEFGQAITALVFDLNALASRVPGDDSREYLVRMKDQLDQMLRATRRMSRELRPAVLDDLGLEAAVEWQTREFSNRTAIPCRLISGLGDVPVPRAAATATFRILQEALTNVARHAGARKVAVHLGAEDGHLHLMVTDDGRGAPADRLSGGHSLGILGMRERAKMLGGTLEIETPREGGTRVNVAMPIRGLR